MAMGGYNLQNQVSKTVIDFLSVTESIIAE